MSVRVCVLNKLSRDTKAAGPEHSMDSVDLNR